jgi:hypothetical protein
MFAQSVSKSLILPIEHGVSVGQVCPLHSIDVVFSPDAAVIEQYSELDESLNLALSL